MEPGQWPDSLPGHPEPLCDRLEPSDHLRDVADARICRNEYFIGVGIYTRSGMLAQGLSSLPTLLSVPG